MNKNIIPDLKNMDKHLTTEWIGHNLYMTYTNEFRDIRCLATLNKKAALDFLLLKEKENLCLYGQHGDAFYQYVRVDDDNRTFHGFAGGTRQGSIRTDRESFDALIEYIKEGLVR